MSTLPISFQLSAKPLKPIPSCHRHHSLLLITYHYPQYFSHISLSNPSDRLECDMYDIQATKMQEDITHYRQLRLYTNIGVLGSFTGGFKYSPIFTTSGLHGPHVAPSQHRFCLADAVYESLGQISFLPSMLFRVQSKWVGTNTVSATTPTLTGMDVLEKEALTPCTPTKHLV